jgi:hypothetical protein
MGAKIATMQPHGRSPHFRAAFVGVIQHAEFEGEIQRVVL